ncbi:alpha/beta fold hydrolase [Rhodanobacter sp. BL-MT-08]
MQSIPFHFGVDSELFGIYHPVALAADRSVLLCPPLGQDLIRSHRLYRQLAEALAAAGIPVLRFDYFGTGDSAGDSMDVDWHRALADVSTAASELHALSHCRRIHAFGARLGGSLALTAAATGLFDCLVVWDPVLNGAAHAAQLDALQTLLRDDLGRFVKSRSADDAADQWMGFAVSPRWRRQVAAVRISSVLARTVFLDSLPAGSPSGNSYSAITGVGMEKLQNPTLWDDLDRVEHAILSAELIRIATNHLRLAA